MRFHYGAIPHSPDFVPDGSWKAMREPGPLLAQCLAIPMGIVVCIFLGAAWLWMTPLRAGDLDSTLASLTLWELGLGFVGLVVLHELVHAAVHPMAGRSPRTILGFWPSRGIFYAHYDGEIGRNRLLAVLLAPLVVISILPLILLSAAHVPSARIAFLSELNCFMACVDIFGSILLLFQVPAGAIMRNQGWKSYWKQ